MRERLCRYCQKAFQPSKYRPEQAVCSGSTCQLQRRNDYHRQKLKTDGVYRQVCLDSPQKWRTQNRGYWRQYRVKHPEIAERNRKRQHLRDQRRRLRHLANNNLVLNLKFSPAEVWVIGPVVTDLANNNSASGKIVIFETVTHCLNLSGPACKQQPDGAAPAFDP